ncbi:Uncharacterized protein DAT39_022279, partial [Clarias magur]
PSLAVLHCPVVIQVLLEEGHHLPLAVPRDTFRLSLLCRFFHRLADTSYCCNTTPRPSTSVPLAFFAYCCALEPISHHNQLNFGPSSLYQPVSHCHLLQLLIPQDQQISPLQHLNNSL